MCFLEGSTTLLSTDERNGAFYLFDIPLTESEDGPLQVCFASGAAGSMDAAHLMIATL